MKVVAYCALHYGVDYLAYAIRSVIDHVDEFYILYSRQGSHGHRTDIPCPDNRDTLLDIAYRACGKKLRWFEGDWTYEGQQRETIHELCPDADVILVVDSDEVWNRVTVQEMTGGYGKLMAIQYNYSSLRLPIIHFWRSFNRCVLHDPAFPTRVLFPKATGIEYTSPQPPICHLGYAQRSEIVEYKLKTHGHKNEFRRDCDWFNDVFMENRQFDCHPVGSEYWNPEQVNPMDYMPAWMSEHPYYGLDVIP